MPARTTHAPGSPCWIELYTSDADRSRAFYPVLLGWDALPASEEFGGYFQFARDGVPIAGCMPADPAAGMPDTWSVYLTSEDAEKTCATAEAAGAQVHVPPMTVEGLGTMAFLSDPTGAGVGVWQPRGFDGFGVLAEPGAPSWFELHPTDRERAEAFYRDVFGWHTQVIEADGEPPYTVLVEGGEWRAGIADASYLPEGLPSHWVTYIGVEDTDAAVARAVELGGSVLEPAEDSEYGRIATLADPSGARFRVVAANEMMPAQSD